MPTAPEDTKDEQQASACRSWYKYGVQGGQPPPGCRSWAHPVGCSGRGCPPWADSGHAATCRWPGLLKAEELLDIPDGQAFRLPQSADVGPCCGKVDDGELIQKHDDRLHSGSVE